MRKRHMRRWRRRRLGCDLQRIDAPETALMYPQFAAVSLELDQFISRSRGLELPLINDDPEFIGAFEADDFNAV